MTLKPLVSQQSTEIVEVAKQNEFAESTTSLQSLIEKHALELSRIKTEKKLKRESLKSIFDNDIQYQEAKAEADKHSQVLKERKSQIQIDPQATSLKLDIAELNQQQKELEETLSNHIVSYHAMTNSTSIDTSNGDQWDFKIKATIKPKQLKLFEK